MRAEIQPNLRIRRSRNTGPWLVMAAALVCLGPTGWHSSRTLPDAVPAEAKGTTLAQREVESIADDYLSALLEYRPELGTQYSLTGARHDRLADHSPEALAAWQAREDAWLAELDARGVPAQVGSRDWVTYGRLFGLIMVLTFTGSLSAATAGREETRTMLFGAIGCNLAWGIVDAFMYLINTLTERGQGILKLRQVRAAKSPEAARRMIAGVTWFLFSSS